MAERAEIRVIRVKVDSSSALRSIEGVAGGAVFERCVLYPYISFKARCEISTIIGKKTLSFDCLVDALNGHAATADAFSTEGTEVTGETLLRASVAHDDARQAAQRTVTHRLSKKLRMIAPFDVELESSGLVYKRFWVIRVGESKVMADSVTGNMHPLRANAA